MAVVRCLMNLAKVPNDAMIHSPNRILPTRSVCEAGFWQGSILGHLVIRSAKQVYWYFPSSLQLEIQTCIEGKSPVGDRKIGLGRSTRRICRCQSPEVDAVDVRSSCYQRPPRIVH